MEALLLLSLVLFTYFFLSVSLFIAAHIEQEVTFIYLSIKLSHFITIFHPSREFCIILTWRSSSSQQDQQDMLTREASRSSH